MRGMNVIVAMSLAILLCLVCSPGTANEPGVVNGSAGSDSITGVISAEVASVPTYAPEIPPFLNDLDPRTSSEMNPAPCTLLDEIASTSGSETYVFVTKWGSSNPSNWQLNSPYGIAIDS
ncbi:MAG: hypothetical protein WC295_03720 [Methanoregula sp.]|jgi:hypothetical protein